MRKKTKKTMAKLASYPKFVRFCFYLSKKINVKYCLKIGALLSEMHHNILLIFVVAN